MEKADLEGIVHDLNNVFQTVGDSAELLQSDPKWLKLAGTLQRSAAHGQRLVGSLIATKSHTGPAFSAVESAIQFARDYLECVHGPTLQFTHLIEDGFQWTGDPAAWERVLINLLLNAAEAGARSVNIEASAGRLVVRDDGPGIAPELLPRIFQPHVSTKSIFSGLGLYVVRSIVEQNGGAVSAANRASGGAEFHIRLRAS